MKTMVAIFMLCVTGVILMPMVPCVAVAYGPEWMRLEDGTPSLGVLLSSLFAFFFCLKGMLDSLKVLAGHEKGGE